LKKLAILSTHPIQYNAPFFRLLAQSEKIRPKVFYTWDRSQNPYDAGFGREIHWDTPLLDGYESCFVKNTSSHPGSHHFRGIINPGLIAEIESWNPDILLVYGWAFRSHLQAMRHFKGKIPVWFRGDSTLLDYHFQSLSGLFKHIFRGSKINSGSRSIPSSLSSWFRFRLRSLVLSRVYSFVDIAFYAGIENKIYFLQHGLKENQLVWMPHAIDNDFFNKDHDQKEKEALEWRRSLGIPDESFVLLYAGKMLTSKAPDMLLRAFLDLAPLNPSASSLRNSGGNYSPTQQTPATHDPEHEPSNLEPGTQNSELGTRNIQPRTRNPEHGTQNIQPGTRNPEPKIHLLLVGSGPLEQELKSKSADHPNIHHLPFQNQSKMPLVYRMGNLFCLPATGPETWGLAVNEALASGRPVLVSDRVGCAKDLVKSQVTGEIFHAGDEKEMIEKIRFILNNRSNYPIKGIQEYISNYSYKQDVEAIESLI
jgi:glycosyltransferase involved in cell wall biosynthesis